MPISPASASWGISWCCTTAKWLSLFVCASETSGHVRQAAPPACSVLFCPPDVGTCYLPEVVLRARSSSQPPLVAFCGRCHRPASSSSSCLRAADAVLHPHRAAALYITRLSACIVRYHEIICGARVRCTHTTHETMILHFGGLSTGAACVRACVRAMFRSRLNWTRTMQAAEAGLSSKRVVERHAVGADALAHAELMSIAFFKSS